MASQTSPLLSPEQYLEIDSRAERPSEYYDGVMYPIEATSLRHGRIQQNIAFGLRQRLQGPSPCEAHGPTIRVKLPNKRYAYPDVVVVCGKIEVDAKKYDTVLNPTVVVEILSPSTADFDRGAKANLYRAIPTLRDFVIVAQDRMLVQLYKRQQDDVWTLLQFSQADSRLPLDSIGVQFALQEIYERVEFDPEA